MKIWSATNHITQYQRSHCQSSFSEQVYPFPCNRDVNKFQLKTANVRSGFSTKHAMETCFALKCSKLCPFMWIHEVAS